MAKLYNLARMTTATTGTGTITLGSAVASYVTFANAGVQNGDTVTYAIVDGNNREVGRGVYTSSGTTLTRATILESTNSNAAINLSGNAEVFITAAAEDIANVGETNTFTASQIISVTDNTNAALRVTQLGTGDAIRVEDSTNPDSSPFIVTNSGDVVIGNTSALAKVDIGPVDSADEGAEIRLRGATNATMDYFIDAYQSSLRFAKADKGSTANAAVRFQIGSAGQWGIGGATYGTSGQVLTSGGASAAPSWTDKMTLIGTITTTSGTSASISGLTLTPYKMLFIVFDGVSHDSGSGQTLLLGTSTADDIAISTNATFGSGATVRGIVTTDLTNGVSTSFVDNFSSTGAGTVPARFAGLPIRTSSTSISVAFSAGNLDAGSVRVYGI